MKHARGIVTTLIIAALAAGGVLLLAYFTRGSTDTGYQSPTYFAMDTSLDINIQGVPEEKARQDVGAAFEYVQKLENETSMFKPGSDVALINQNAGVAPVKVHPDTLAMIERSLEFSRLSDGAFDITVAPVVRLWGFYDDQHRVPSQEEIDQALKLVDYNKVIVDRENQTVMLAEPGMEIDLGSVAKGYAVEGVKTLLEERGVKSGLVNFGGSVGAIGKRQDGKPWVVGVKSPRGGANDLLGTLSIENQYVDSSGDYERFFIADGKRYCHIIDARTGRQTDSTMEVTTVGPNAVDGDILNTVLFMVGPEKGMEMLKQFNGMSATLVDASGKVINSPGFDRYVITMKESV